jgi:hypothetical protein
MNLVNYLKQLNLILFLVSSKKNKKVFHKNVRIEIIKSDNKKKYKINNIKSERLKKKNLLIILKDKKNLIGSGWIYFGKDEWAVSEIKKKIFIKNYYLLYDFIIIKKYRNMGYYSDFLTLIKKNFFKNNLCIYVSINNFYSLKGIRSSGFVLQKIISKFFTLNL